MSEYLPDDIDFSKFDIAAAMSLRARLLEQDMSAEEAAEFLKRETQMLLRSEVRDFVAESEAFNDGYRAFGSGIPRYENPYKGVEFLEASWDLGWSTAQHTVLSGR